MGGSFDGLGASLVPPLAFLALNLVEAQFVTPTVIGRTLTMNPFIVLIALAFWLWIWGPLGGFIAVPALLVLYAIVGNIVPGVDWTARREGARMAGWGPKNGRAALQTEEWKHDTSWMQIGNGRLLKSTLRHLGTNRTRLPRVFPT